MNARIRSEKKVFVFALAFMAVSVPLTALADEGHTVEVPAVEDPDAEPVFEGRPMIDARPATLTTASGDRTYGATGVNVGGQATGHSLGTEAYPGFNEASRTEGSVGIEHDRIRINPANGDTPGRIKGLSAEASLSVGQNTFDLSEKARDLGGYYGMVAQGHSQTAVELRGSASAELGATGLSGRGCSWYGTGRVTGELEVSSEEVSPVDDDALRAAGGAEGGLHCNVLGQFDVLAGPALLLNVGDSGDGNDLALDVGARARLLSDRVGVEVAAGHSFGSSGYTNHFELGADVQVLQNLAVGAQTFVNNRSYDSDTGLYGAGIGFGGYSVPRRQDTEVGGALRAVYTF